MALGPDPSQQPSHPPSLPSAVCADMLCVLSCTQNKLVQNQDAVLAWVQDTLHGLGPVLQIPQHTLLQVRRWCVVAWAMQQQGWGGAVQV